jgi:DNA polymerase-3 subunit delta'
VPETCAAARQVRAQSHPGLLVLRRPYDQRAKRFAASIPVDEVRQLKSFLGLTAGEGAWRVVIVDAADDLNVNAANALLKSLEEPPRRALFLLVVAEPSRLLPTIRSRCRRLDLAPLASEPLRQACEAALAAAGADGPEARQWPTLERLAEGSVRRALQLAGSGGLELYERIEALLTSLPALDWPAVHALSDQLSSSAQEQRFEAFFELLLDLLARLVRLRASGRGDTPESELAQRLIPDARLPAWASAWEAILRERNDAALLNLDRRALITGTFAKLEALARR